MPLTRITCPHCEQPVEVSMTSVTRSRPCPHCGRTIMLQFTTRDKRQRRKALLTSATVLDELEHPGEDATPRPIEGDLRERMLRDPEVVQRVRSLKLSLTLLALVILLVVLASVFHWWAAIASTMGQAMEKIRPTHPKEAPTTAVGMPPQATLKGRDTTPSSPPPTESVNPSANLPSAPPVDDTPLLSVDQEAAMKAVTGFLKAPNVEERLKYIRSRVALEPRLRDYYRQHDSGPVNYEHLESLGADPNSEHAFTFVVVMKDGERRGIKVKRSQGSGFLVDWASFVIYSEMDWAAFLKERPQKGVLFRLRAETGNEYRGAFADANVYFCLKLTNPLNAHEEPIYAYAERGTSLGHTLEFVMRRDSGTASPLMLKLKFPDAAGSPNQVLVDEFVGEGWLGHSW